MSRKFVQELRTRIFQPEFPRRHFRWFLEAVVVREVRRFQNRYCSAMWSDSDPRQFQSGRHFLFADVNRLQYDVPILTVPARQGKEFLLRWSSGIVDQLTIQIAAHAVRLKGYPNIVPAIGFDTSTHGPSNGSLIEFDGVLRISPSTQVPPVSVRAFPAKDDKEPFAAA